MTRSAVRMGLALVALVVGAAPSEARRPSFGEYVKVSRALKEWRIDEARRLLGELEQRAPDAPETAYFRAELLFYEGDYAGARKILAELDHPRTRDLVRDLRPLVEATWATTRDFHQKELDHFVISYPPGRDEVLVEVAGEALEKAYRAINEDLGHTPPGKIRVELLSRPADLARLSTLTEKEIETSGTIALCKYNKLMVVSPRATIFGYPWLDTLAHEYAHYVISQASRDKVPIWFHEGLAKFQESRWRAGAGEVGMGATHKHVLANALKKGRLISFEEMHPSMAKLPSQEAAATAFAEVYTMMAYLHERVGYEGLRDAIARMREGASAKRAVAEVLDTTWVKVEKDWKRYLKRLDLTVDPAHGKRPVVTHRFRKGAKESPEDETNLGLEEITEDRARRFARLGGFLAARGRWAAAAVEYEKALTMAGPGSPFVAGRLARAYLEMGKPQKAAEAAEPLVARDPEDAHPRTTLGVAYLEMGEAHKAAAELEVALRISPFDPRVRCGLAEAYASLEDSRASRERRACHILGGRAKLGPDSPSTND